MATYACLVTVILPVTHRLASEGARTAALLTIILSLGGGLLVRRAGNLGKFVLSILVVGASLATWVLAKNLLGTRLDPWLGACGAVAWALWAITWARNEPTDLPHTRGESTGFPHTGPDLASKLAPAVGRRIDPRAELPRLALVLSLTGCLAGAMLLVLAWWVSDRGRAMTAQGVALTGAALSAFGSLRIAAAWASPSPARQAFGRERDPAHWPQAIYRARWSLLLVLCVVLGGLLAGPVLGLVVL